VAMREVRAKGVSSPVGRRNQNHKIMIIKRETTTMMREGTIMGMGEVKMKMTGEMKRIILINIGSRKIK